MNMFGSTHIKRFVNFAFVKKRVGSRRDDARVRFGTNGSEDVAATGDGRCPGAVTYLAWMILMMVGFVLPVSGAGAKLTTEQTEFFEKKIRPVLVAECYECHSVKKQKGGLRVDFRDGLLKGGDTGPSIVPGDVAKSLLITSITHQTEELKMPKKAPKLDEAIIQDFIVWVKMGAPDPRDEAPTEAVAAAPVPWAQTLAARKLWWSFQPVHKVEVPAVKDVAWSDHPVDRFILAKMEAAGLQPAAAADKRVLIRRVTFALTGLPPTTAEIADFLADNSAEAYAKLVDRLLASPRFGERWARHWMDLVRFAETHGSEGDTEIPEAWRYRDYLIRALNNDVPVDQLIRENLAGDLLPKPRWNREEGINESVLGIGQLRMVEHGFQPVDTLDEQVRNVDNQIDVVSKAFLGLTVSCARCHDHKFDAISQKDFYALYGIFESARPALVTIDAPEVLNRHRAELAALKEKIRSGLISAWQTAAQELPERLNTATTMGVQYQELQQRVQSLEHAVAAMDLQARLAAMGGANGGYKLQFPTPTSWWTFEGDARDLVGPLHGTLEGGAVIRNGRLVLNGEDAYVRTEALKEPLREKTLEAWVSLATLSQGGGGVVTVESGNGSIFDSIVYAERQAGKWLAGSNNHRRTRDFNGVTETAGTNELVHVAIVYDKENRITGYRNGVLYGSSYIPESDEAALHEFGARDGHLLFGKRHLGGAKSFLKGEIEEVRLYARALTAEELAASFKAGPVHLKSEDLAKATTPVSNEERTKLVSELEQARKQLTELERKNGGWLKVLAEADKDPAHPLHAWAILRGRVGSAFTDGWQQLRKEGMGETEGRVQFNRANFTNAWDLTGDGAAKWFRYGDGLSESVSRSGAFSIEPAGDLVVRELLPAGVYTHLLSQKDNGLFTSPRFKVTSDWISVRALGGQGAMVRLIVDNYPLGLNNIFPRAELKRDTMGWVRMDTAYRKGSYAYLEIGTADDLARRYAPAKNGPGTEGEGRSWFGVQAITFHDGKEPPRETVDANAWLWQQTSPASAQELGRRYEEGLTQAIQAWQRGELTEVQRALLDAFVQRDLMPRSLAQLPMVAPLVRQYRQLEAELAVPRRAPGVIEAVAINQPLFTRGDFTKPTEPVPRRFLEAFDSKPYETQLSGRLELANDIASPTNPLTARVAVNRLWQHLFGRGIVPSVDNFGRLGEKPTHPELLDYLAAKFVADGWSTKRMLRFLLLSRTYQLSSEPSAEARAKDPANELLSHARIQRLEAEAVRDSLLAVSSRLDTRMYGVGENALAGGDNQRRRSVYLTIRRNSLSPFLAVFDAPKPFTTQGRRDVTNVPAQSLAFLNDPMVIEMARQWAHELLRTQPGQSRDERVRVMFEQAFGRLPGDTELAGAAQYLDDLAAAHQVAVAQMGTSEPVWQDFAQSLFNLKEFIYLR